MGSFVCPFGRTMGKRGVGKGERLASWDGMHRGSAWEKVTLVPSFTCPASSRGKRRCVPVLCQPELKGRKGPRLLARIIMGQYLASYEEKRKTAQNPPFFLFGQRRLCVEEMIQEIAFPVILLLPQRSSVLLFVLLFVCDAAVQSQSRKFAAIPLLLCLPLPPTHFFVSPPLSAALE